MVRTTAAYPGFTRFTPPAPTASEEKPRRAAVVRRFLERFALIAFALYHLPLFVNNYPSLGGGGFNNDGLAPRWGHIFTPPGVWVARHIFHITGPMPGAYQGDNGDVAEEFGRLLLCVVIGVIGALAWTFADRRKPRAAWTGETLRVLLRYSIALGILSYGIAKLLPMQFPPIGASTLEQRVGNLSPMALLWTFMEYSRPYAFFGGLMECVAALLLCFRRTATLGAMVCLAVMTNVALLNFAYGVPVKLYSTMIALSAAVLLLYDAKRLIAVFVSNRATLPAADRSVFHERITTPWRWTIKVLLVGSVAASSVAAMHPPIAARIDKSPVAGTWTVTSAGSTGWRQLTVDALSVVIHTASDSTLICGRTNEVGMLAFRCRGGRRGELHWTRSGDTLHLDGTMDNAAVAVTARRSDAAYPLLRSRFHLITD